MSSPRSPRPPGPDYEPQEVAGRQKNTKPVRATILIVEDEQQIRDLMKAVLEVDGYAVIAARDGIEGLQRYRENKDRVDLVVTDSTMPGMNGPEMIEKILAITPDAKVILASGSVAEKQTDEFTRAVWLQKPYSARELKEAVRRLCES